MLPGDGVAGCARDFGRPDETAHYDHAVLEIIEFGDVTVGRITAQPGWRWSEHMQPVIGGELCEARHVWAGPAGAVLLHLQVRGLAVHEAARIMALAGADEVLTSETARVLAAGPATSFADRGLHLLKGLDGERRLFAYLGGGESA
jgi:hypothetical protein